MCEVPTLVGGGTSRLERGAFICIMVDFLVSSVVDFLDKEQEIFYAWSNVKQYLLLRKQNDQNNVGEENSLNNG